jgi:hypothetical protein
MIQVIHGVLESHLTFSNVALNIGVEDGEAGGAEKVFSFQIHRRGYDPVGGGIKPRPGEEECVATHIDVGVVRARSRSHVHAQYGECSDLPGDWVGQARKANALGRLCEPHLEKGLSELLQLGRKCVFIIVGKVTRAGFGGGPVLILGEVGEPVTEGCLVGEHGRLDVAVPFGPCLQPEA